MHSDISAEEGMPELLQVPENVDPVVAIITSPNAALLTAVARSCVNTVVEHDDDPEELLNPEAQVTQSAEES
jgi:hypothetical protein